MLNQNIIHSKKSLGLQANGSLHQLYQLSDMDARHCHFIKKQNEHSSLTKADDTKLLCHLLSCVTKSCFDILQQKVTMAKQCVSEQKDASEWCVIYYRQTKFDNTNVKCIHHLPYLKQIRTVQQNICGHLTCSCKCYERYGYPCHRLFHILKCYKTNDVKHEWIHI